MHTQILIAEDDIYLRTLFAKAFRNGTFEVTTAGDSEEALYHLNKKMPDVLILDVNLPGQSGLEIAKYVRRHEKFMRQQNGEDLGVKIIVVTGDVNARHSHEALLADAFLLKPVSIRELVALAEKLHRQSLHNRLQRNQNANQT